MPDKKHLESMIFDFGTTNRTDYRDIQIKGPIKTVFKEKSPCLRVRPPPLKDIHTLVDWAVPIVPFNLFHKPKEVVRTNPYHVQKTFSKPEDEGRAEAQKTRPRFVMTPAASLDDVEGHCRALLIGDLYQSTAHRALEEGVLPTKDMRAPFPGVYAPASPITLKVLEPWPVSPEWRMDSVGWDCRQVRSYCDPTEMFWLQRTPKCSVCDATAARVAQKKMERQIRKRS